MQCHAEPSLKLRIVAIAVAYRQSQLPMGLPNVSFRPSGSVVSMIDDETRQVGHLVQLR
jgi:hypothetical protein